MLISQKKIKKKRFIALRDLEIQKTTFWNNQVLTWNSESLIIKKIVNSKT